MVEGVKIYADRNVPNMLYLRDESVAFDISFDEEDKPTHILKVEGKEKVEEAVKVCLEKNYMDFKEIQEFEVKLLEGYINKYGSNYKKK